MDERTRAHIHRIGYEQTVGAVAGHCAENRLEHYGQRKKKKKKKEKKGRKRRLETDKYEFM